MQVIELQGLLKRAKDNIEESLSRAQIERADKEMRVHQSDGEVERFKSMLQAKEGRLGDLERQHQEDRSRLLALHSKLELSERFASDLTALSNQEKEKGERLEKRLQLMQAELNTKSKSPRGSRTMGSLAGAILSARNEVRHFSMSDGHHIYNGGEAMAGRNGREFEEGARGEGDYRSLREDAYQERKESFTEKPYRDTSPLATHAHSNPSNTSFEIDESPRYDNIALRSYVTSANGTDSDHSPSKSSSAPSGDTGYQSNLPQGYQVNTQGSPGPKGLQFNLQGYQSNPPLGLNGPGSQDLTQQSPIDRVAAALASRALKDRGAAFAPPAQHTQHTQHTVSQSLLNASNVSTGGVGSSGAAGMVAAAAAAASKRMHDIQTASGRNGRGGGDEDEYESETTATEDSIQRTEAYLRRKLSGGGPPAAARSTSTNSTATNSNNSNSKIRDRDAPPNHHKQLNQQQLAYNNRDNREESEDREDDEDEEEDEAGEPFHLGPPGIVYRPIDPPSQPSPSSYHPAGPHGIRSVRDDVADSPGSVSGSSSRRNSEKENERDWRRLPSGGFPASSGGSGGPGGAGGGSKLPIITAAGKGNQGNTRSAESWDDRSTRR